MRLHKWAVKIAGQEEWLRTEEFVDEDGVDKCGNQFYGPWFKEAEKKAIENDFIEHDRMFYIEQTRSVNEQSNS